MDDLISVKNLTKKYGEKIALDDMSLNLSSGKVIGLLGPNGSGKTTLLKILAGLVKADSGEILIDGISPSNKTKAFTAFLPDTYFLIEDMNLANTIDVFDDFYEDFDKEFCLKLVEYFALNNNDLTSSMSKGDREKLNLCLTLSRDAKIYLLDEPLDGLDPISIDKITDIIIDKVGDDKTFLITTHQIDNLENLFDQVVFLDRGKVAYQEDANILREKQQMSISDYYDEIYIG